MAARLGMSTYRGGDERAWAGSEPVGLLAGRAEGGSAPTAYWVLVLSSLGAACALSLCDGGPWAARPWLPAAAAALLWPNCKSPRLAGLQAIVGLVLCFVPLGAATEGRFVPAVAGHRLSLPAGTGVFALLFFAYLSVRRRDGLCAAWRPIAWAAAYTIVAVHAVFLWALFGGVYGYGYERSAALMAKMGLFFLASMALREAWANSQTRRAIGVMLFAAYALCAILKGGSGWSR